MTLDTPMPGERASHGRRGLLEVAQEADVTREALHDVSQEARRLRVYLGRRGGA